MPSDRIAKEVAAAPDLELDDRISALPDGVLQHVLGFLPADEAVRTCVLARQWRDQWRSMRRLRIDCDIPRTTEDFIKLVNRLLLLRAPGMDLDEFEVSTRYWEPLYEELDEEIRIWIRHALMCKAMTLIIDLPITLKNPLISQHLRRLEVNYVVLVAGFLDFATCPTLEFLDIKYSKLFCSRILSQSVKHLQIMHSHFSIDIQACISIPSLISLQLNSFGGLAPLLEFMPSLRTAFVKPSCCWDGCTDKGDPGIKRCRTCACCCGKVDHRGRCLVLGGLSNAMHLELITYCGGGTSIFRRDMRWCPTFSKLKTLLLTEWCAATDFSALVCILEHSPVLEKLILQFSRDTEHKSKSEGRNYQMERKPHVSKHLKIVEIKCINVGIRVSEFFSFLSTFVVKVNIIRDIRDSTLGFKY